VRDSTWFRKLARRRLRAAELPDGNAEPLRLVGEIVLNSRAGEVHEADRQQFEHGVVALEWCCLGVPGPIRLESNLWYLAVNSPFGGDQFSAFWRAAMDQDHVGMFSAHLVETIPDQVMVVEVEAARQRDLGSWWQHDLGFGTALGCEIISGVDHRRGQRAVVDQ